MIQVARDLAMGVMVEQRTLQLNGIRIRYACVGYGPPLVLIHAGGTQSSWHVWRDNIASLATHYQVLVPDLPGRGESDPLPVAVDSEDDFFRHYPRFVKAFLEEMAPEGAVLVGAASGGGICLTVAARYSELVQSLVLVDAEVIGRVIETETSLLRCPTLIIWQRDDLLVPPTHATTLASRIPGAELRLFPGDESRDEWGGNMPHRLWPSEFDATVLDFLDRVQSQRPSVR